MGFKGKGQLIQVLAFCLLLMAAPGISAQNSSAQKDSLVRLVKGSSVQLIEKFDKKYRKAVDATFLHNGTFLICDTAFWNVDEKVINAEGHVQLIQEGTVLTSDRLDYYVDDNLAKFRGSLVQLQDRERNTLRTHELDYNTKDSVAVFRKGGAMKDKDGQIMESIDGTYDSKIATFTFSNDVNMFTDSVFVRTTLMNYNTDDDFARFLAPIDFWKDGKMLSSSAGWYDHGAETFFFEGKVHSLSENQEAWSDSLYYYRASENLLMLGHAQIQDTTRNISAVGGRVFYCDTLSRVVLSRDAAVAMQTKEDEKIDTIYFGADTIIYHTIRYCDIPENEISDAKTRLEDINTDPVTEYRQKAAKEAAAAAAEAAKNNPNVPPPPSKRGLKQSAEDAPAVSDSLPDQVRLPARDSLAVRDSLSVGDSLAVADSLAVPSDSLAIADSLAALPPLDTTKVGFLEGIGNVKIFRKDIQVLCDSMRYNDLDSIARFYIDPVVWNDGNRQYTSDSLFVLVKEGGADRASLLSNAFIITQEDSLCFDQIKGTEVVAYFDTTSALRRFDALGGATALFYLEENDALATVNKVECKMLSGLFVEGQLDRVFYFDSPHNDAYPLVQMPVADRTLKGFNWRIDERPSGKSDITSLEVRRSERRAYESRPKAVFKQTDRYFPGYMKGVYREIAVRDSLARLPKPAKTTPVHADSLLVCDSLVVAVADSLSAAVDSTLAQVQADSLALHAAVDSLSAAVVDSMAVVHEPTPAEIKAQLRAQRKAEREAKRAAKQAAREARWAELDARDAAKAEAKRQAALARKREQTRKDLIADQKRQQKEKALLDKYIRMYEQKKNL